jgi:glycosyltransferase involved in cell wall biosynthesis
VIGAVGVVIPAHNEEELLPSCLAALRMAIRVIAPVPVHLIVVADACDDRTAEAARAGGATVLEIRARSVGAARDAGMAEVLSRTRQLSPESVWLATTDADTLVPPSWLSRQFQYAELGWEAVVGTVTVTDWAGHPPEVPPLFLERYGGADGTHPHVHGANLGFSASAYQAAGGFGPGVTAEDHALVRALTAAGSRILRTTTVSVVTSARRCARAPLGFSHLLSALASSQVAVS